MSTITAENRRGMYARHRSPQGIAEAAQAVIHALKPVAHEIDAIAVRGLSGIIPGAIAAHALGKHLIVSRKSEQTHGRRIEGLDEAIRAHTTPLSVAIVDDFVASGRTLAALGRDLGPNNVVTYLVLYEENTMDPHRYGCIRQTQDRWKVPRWPEPRWPVP